MSCCKNHRGSVMDSSNGCFTQFASSWLRMHAVLLCVQEEKRAMLPKYSVDNGTPQVSNGTLPGEAKSCRCESD
jgi:hypothetical protein